jgi:apolipoprotein N-acyltransferase
MTMRASFAVNNRSIVLIVLVSAGMFAGLPNPFWQNSFLVLLVPAALYAIAWHVRSASAAFRLGWLASGAGAAAAVYWVAYPVHVYGMLPWPLAVPCALLLGAWIGLFGAVFSCIMHLLVRPYSRGTLPLFWQNALLLCTAAGCLWGILEWFRGIFLTGFPWATLASAFVAVPQMLQAASVVGGTALGAFFACAACCSVHLCAGTLRCRRLSVISVAILGIIALFGFYRTGSFSPQGEEYDVALIQGNIDQGQKWLPEYQQGTADRYISMSQGAADKLKPDLIIWPETSMPFYFQEHALGDDIRRAVAGLGVPLLLGTPGYTLGPQAGSYTTYNRAYVLDKQGRDIGFYDKEHLVPFGEYLPSFLNLEFLQTMMQGVGDFTPGKQTTPVRTGNLALGILVCYESIFPELAQQRVADGATLLVNISNDAWFGNTSAPRQHLHLTAVRAVEQGRYIARCTNTGISAIIDPFGRMQETGPLFRPAVVGGAVKSITKKTVYHLIYQWIMPAMLVVFCTTAFCLLQTGRRQTPQ